MAYDGHKLTCQRVCMGLLNLNLSGMIDYDVQLKGYFIKRVT